MARMAGLLGRKRTALEMECPDNTPVNPPLLLCPKCKLEMMLRGTETESAIRDLYTFQCAMCGKLEVRGVLVAAPK